MSSSSAPPLLAVFVFGFAAAIASPAADGDWVRDWVKDPAVVQIDTSSDIFAIGDAHSDYARLALAMKAAGLIAGVPKQPEDVQVERGQRSTRGHRRHDR